MAIMTVLGPIAPAQLGVTLAHEHCFIDLRNQYSEPVDIERRALGRSELSLANAGILRRNPYALRDNLLLEDLTVATNELQFYAEAGGRSLVDCTSLGIGRDPLGLKLLARATNINIIAGCGYYTADTHPPKMNVWDFDDLAQDMYYDLTRGMEGTTVRAGVIGEIGTSWPIHSNEIKCLKAAAQVQLVTGTAIYVHCYPWGTGGLQALEILCTAGVKANKIVICHADVALDLHYIRNLLREGVYVEFDNFGKEFYIDAPDRGFAGGIFARDIERVRTIKKLFDDGYLYQLLISNDICLKSMLHTYGGWGYDHILAHIVPMLREARVLEDQVWEMLINNPARVLDSKLVEMPAESAT